MRVLGFDVAIRGDHSSATSFKLEAIVDDSDNTLFSVGGEATKLKVGAALVVRFHRPEETPVLFEESTRVVHAVDFVPTVPPMEPRSVPPKRAPTFSLVASPPTLNRVLSESSTIASSLKLVAEE